MTFRREPNAWERIKLLNGTMGGYQAGQFRRPLGGGFPEGYTPGNEDSETLIVVADKPVDEDYWEAYQDAFAGVAEKATDQPKQPAHSAGATAVKPVVTVEVDLRVPEDAQLSPAPHSPAPAGAAEHLPVR